MIVKPLALIDFNKMQPVLLSSLSAASWSIHGNGVIYGVLSSAAVILLGYVVYNLYFHPLSGIPGPKLAALTNNWSIYYELQGRLVSKTTELVETYDSEIIRIGPNRVALCDPEMYNQIYHSGSKFLKDPSFYNAFPQGGGTTTNTASDRYVHSKRRKLLSPKMSRQAVLQLQPLLAKKLEQLLAIFAKRAEENKSVDLLNGWRSMTMDFISTFAFGYSIDTLGHENFDHEMIHTINAMASGFYLFVRFPILSRIVKFLAALPLIGSTTGTAASGNRFQQWATNCIDSYVPNATTGEINLFDGLLDPPEKAERVTRSQAIEEAFEILVAGSDTTATTLTYACFHLFKNPELADRLFAEISIVIPTRTTIPLWTDLETLPLLTACIKESLRLASPVPAFLPRVVPPGGWSYKGKFLPAQTVVGMSQTSIHFNPEIFEDPLAFKPDRWLGGKGQSLDQYLVPFSKGTRQCMGINMANEELYISLATVIRRFKGTVAPYVTEEGLRELEFFVGIAKVNNCDVYLEERVQ